MSKLCMTYAEPVYLIPAPKLVTYVLGEAVVSPVYLLQLKVYRGESVEEGRQACKPHSLLCTEKGRY